MPTIFQSIINFLNVVLNWFNDSFVSGSLDFLAVFAKAFLNIIIAVLSFIIDILKWIVEKI